MFIGITVGMAGSGKSNLVGGLLEWFRSREENAVSLNLDPGASVIPYTPDIDIREYISLQGLMEEYELGPNGALILAADLISNYLEEIIESIKEVQPDILLIDTPGQIELFAFRESGPFITKTLEAEGKAVIYLLDAPFCRNPMNYVSNMFIAAAVYNRLFQPQIYVLSKTDLIEEEEKKKILEWSQDVNQLISDLEDSIGSTASLIARDIANTLSRVDFFTEPLPLSNKELTGYLELEAALTRIFTGGERLRP